ncbi:HdeD family acid-resistance protein [Oerskovia flava]|uniref:HdeD family acid-resistance protein n=1 Tax=Oerskovia flava TaxID=2986422 RepID=UPI00223F19AB|nr:DUF308 domain-containing protein [Oerskovia sp. JB1-3-2]
MARRKNRAAEGGADAATAPELPNAFRNVWWLPVIRGVLLIVLGLLLMIEPLESLEILRLVFGAFLVADGVLVAVQGLAHRQQVGWTWWLAQAVVNIVFGAAVVFWPELSVTALYYVLVVWVLVLGIVSIVGAAGLLRNRDLGWAWMLTFGIVSTLFGLLLVTRPLDAVDVLTLVVIVFGLYAFVSGAVHIVSGFAVRSVARELADLRGQAQAAGVVVTGGSVLGASASAPSVRPAHASGPVPATPEGAVAAKPGGPDVPAVPAGPVAPAEPSEHTGAAASTGATEPTGPAGWTGPDGPSGPAASSGRIPRRTGTTPVDGASAGTRDTDDGGTPPGGEGDGSR